MIGWLVAAGAAAFLVYRMYRGVSAPKTAPMRPTPAPARREPPTTRGKRLPTRTRVEAPEEGRQGPYLWLTRTSSGGAVVVSGRTPQEAWSLAALHNCVSLRFRLRHRGAVPVEAVRTLSLCEPDEPCGYGMLRFTVTTASMALSERGPFVPRAHPDRRDPAEESFRGGWAVFDREGQWIVLAAANQSEALLVSAADGRRECDAYGAVRCRPLEAFLLHVSPDSGTYTTRALLLRLDGEEFFWSDGDAPRPVPTRPRPLPTRFRPFSDPDAVFAAMPIPEYRRTRVRPGQRWLEVQRPGRTA